MRSTRHTLMLAALTAILGACAAKQPQAGDLLARRVVRSSPTTLTRTELGAVEPGRNLYETLRMLRPNFLLSHGNVPTVELNGVLVGSPAILQTINVRDVTRVELLNALDATTRHGRRHTGAVLQVEMRP